MARARVRRDTGDRKVSIAIAGAHANGDGPLRLDRYHARQVFERIAGVAASRFDEVDGNVLALGFPELDLDQAPDHIVEDEPEHEDRYRERDAEYRGARAKWVTGDVPKHHATGRAEVLRDERGFEQRAAVSRRHLRPHRLGRRNANRANDGAECTGSCSKERERGGAHNDPRRHGESRAEGRGPALVALALGGKGEGMP